MIDREDVRQSLQVIINVGNDVKGKELSYLSGRYKIEKG